jgi:hypothetical protein
MSQPRELRITTIAAIATLSMMGHSPYAVARGPAPSNQDLASTRHIEEYTELFAHIEDKDYVKRAEEIRALV